MTAKLAVTVRTPRQDRFREQYGPWAVVTGASDGIGREFAHRLAEAGLSLVLVARRRAVLDSLAAELAMQHGVEVRVIGLDLARGEAIEVVGAVTSDLDVGLLVAAAGFGTSGRLLDSDLAMELGMIDINCRAVVALSFMFGRRLAKRGSGGIVLMSSLLAFQGVPRAANYAATKAFVQTLAEGLQRELAPVGVDVVASAPGPIRSGFANRAGMRMSVAQAPKVVAQETLSALGRRGTVRPGLLAKTLEASLTFLPRFGRVRIMAMIMGGMTKHHDGKVPGQNQQSA